MLRQVIHIDTEKCNGCGICAEACHEGAIDIVDGKAKLVRENFCDGFGDCLPGCPMNAITFETRDVPAYDEKAVAAARLNKAVARDIKETLEASENETPEPLINWPIEIKLAPLKQDYFDDADLLIAADCTGYAYARFHEEFVKGRVVLIGCPKLDAVDYSEKLTDIFMNNRIKTITFTRMIVPCCGGLERAVKSAIENSGKEIPLSVVTIGIDGTIMSVREE